MLASIPAAVSVHRTASSPSALVSLPARLRRAVARSACSCRLCCSSSASLSCFCRAATLSSTACSSACFAARLACAVSSSACASRSTLRLGSTTLTTLAYESMARAHMHRLLAALDCLATVSGSNWGSPMYLASCLSTLSGMLSVSYSISRLMKFMSLSSFFALSQSGFSPQRMHTASMVICTSAGGLAKDLISVMSPLLSALSAFCAISNTGSTSLRSASASSLTFCTSMACAVTSATTTLTDSLTLTASASSLETCSSSTAVCLDFSSSTGCRALSSAFIVSTTVLVSWSLLSPLTSRSRACSRSLRFSSSSDT
mmetsp:Transcript_66590/g.210830  ORF Transcript_66590/g.210830 Transcript_66590/m.210830 type:complete len:316 (-) Transcript_66590:363-1310(-)